MLNPLARAVSSATLGEPVVVRNLTMFPLLRPGSGDAPPFYLTLDEALALGVTEVTEVSSRGSVPELRVVNRSGRPVLVLDGEELVGARQNRVVNLTILVPASATLTIPVSCVEAGRWRARSKAFAAAPRAQYASGRAKRMRAVTASLCASGERVADQSAVWADIAEKSQRLGADSPTSAMDAMYVEYAASIDAYVDACRPSAHQVGALFAIDEVVVGFDLFDHHATLARMLPKLVRSVAVDAIDRELQAGTCEAIESASLRPFVERFAAAAARAPQSSSPALGLGEDLRVNGPGLTGAALLADGIVVHFAAFNDAAVQ